MDRTRWPDLAPDALRHIAGRLHDAGDLVRFHAICRPWRDSRDATTANTLSLQPWLLAEDKDSTPLRFRCIFSKSSYRAPSPSTHRRRNWVCRADGTAVRYLTVQQLRPSLHDVLTGEVTHQLPLFLDGQWEEEENPHGVLYGDGTILLYATKYVNSDVASARFRAMLLRPGDAEWTVVERTLEILGYGSFCAAYHDGKILVTMGASLWRIITPNGDDVADDVLVQKQWTWSEDGGDGMEHYNYVLESRGELLWASVWVHMYYGAGPILRVLVYALEEKTRWVKREGRSLNDRVLFLGSPNSFAMDASMLGGGDGGCVYFAYCNTKALPYVQYGVFRYNLISKLRYRYCIDDKAQLVERLPQGWGDVKCTWLVLQPHIASIQEISKRSLEAQELKHHQTALVTSPTRINHISRHYEPCLRLMVRNLPITVNSFQLQLFFSKHGKVSDAEILYYKRTKRSQGIGLLTMSTVHAHQEDALDALRGLVLEGCNLEVILVKKGRPRYGRRRRSTSTRSLDLLDCSHSGNICS